MPPLARALTYRGLAVLAVATVACFLAAPVHELLLDLGWLSEPETDHDYHRGFLKVLRRLLLIPLAVVVFSFEKPWRDGHPRTFGLVGSAARYRPGLIAYVVTVLALGLILAGQLASGWLTWEDPPRWGVFAGRLLRLLPGGVMLAVVEEWFFRGWLIHRSRTKLSARAAILFSAVLFALLHAFRPSTLTTSVSHDAAGAAQAISGWLGYMLDPVAFGPSFVGLFLFALVLTAAYLRTGTLWTAIGLHAGAVLVIFSYGALTERVPLKTWAGTRLLYDGPPAWILLGLAAWLLWPRGELRSGESAAPSGGSAG